MSVFFCGKNRENELYRSFLRLKKGRCTWNVHFIHKLGRIIHYDIKKRKKLAIHQPKNEEDCPTKEEVYIS